MNMFPNVLLIIYLLSLSHTVYGEISCHQDTISSVDGCTVYNGNLNIDTVDILSRARNITFISGFLKFTNTNFTSVVMNSLLRIEGTLIVDGNSHLEELGFESLKLVGSLYIYNNPKLSSMDGFSSLNTVGGQFKVSQNGALSIEALYNLNSVGYLYSYNTPFMKCSNTILQHFHDVLNCSIVCLDTYNVSCFNFSSLDENVCSSEGYCYANDTCICSVTQNRTESCDCFTDHFGEQCEPCQCKNGDCFDGIRGNGTCQCYDGYSGEDCSVFNVESGFLGETVINGEMIVRDRTVSLEGNLRVLGKGNIDSSTILVRNSVEISSDIIISNSTLVFSGNGSRITTQGCINLTDSSISTDITEEEKQNGSVQLMSFSCLNGDYTTSSSSCTNGYTETITRGSTTLNAIFEPCMDPMLMAIVVGSIILGSIIIVVLVVFVSPLRKVIFPYRR
eukprot:TRINITY_DN3744_c0_g1_i1.p1 TRINITY_DN3744_c0_g1~~TRINITY_DN3744_c0_g1_i1.p1  ORF type:complete len:449 (+),score=80.45 TRINITY_DN3744_c0_g1_i1:80-1426(+)